MITFYPRDIGRWRGVFDFNYVPTLVPGPRTDRKEFCNRSELIEFLKQHGAVLTDAANPLTITRHVGEHPTIKGEVHEVIQWTLLGWIKEDYK